MAQDVGGRPLAYEAPNICVSFDRRVGRYWGKERRCEEPRIRFESGAIFAPRAAQEVSKLTRGDPWAELFPKSGISLADLLITRMQFGLIVDVRGGFLSAAASRLLMDVGIEPVTHGWEGDYGSWGSAPSATNFPDRPFGSA